MKDHGYYFSDTFRLAKGEIFVSPFDLNIERGKVELPLKPMIRFGTPVFDSYGKKRGIVLLNYLGSDLLDTFELLSANAPGEILLLNAQGYFLSSPNPDDEWGFMYESRRNRTFAGIFPEAWREISQAESGQFSNADGLYSYTTIRPLAEAQISSSGSGKPFTPSDELIGSKDYHWKIVSHVSPGDLGGWSGPLLARTLKIYAVLLVTLAIGSGFVVHASAKRKQAEEEVKTHRDHLEVLVEQRTAELASACEQIQLDVAERDLLVQAMGERVKELRCLYGVAQSIRMGEALEQILQDVVALIPSGWQYPEIVRGRLRCDDKEYVTEPFEETQWKQSADIVVGGDVRGTIDVFYLAERPKLAEGPFLQEERDLLDGISRNLSEAIERRQTEKQLRQAQKMEAVGQLAGGIAHDFNNILQVMGGHMNFALQGMDSETERYTDLREIEKAIARAAALTRQLLAFSRQQILRLQSVDLNALIEDLMKMIRRVIGEDIVVNVKLGAEIGPIHADPGQIEQILMNLAINARDAMPEGGTIGIDTEDIFIGVDYCETHTWARKGRYALLTVSDTGCGMDTETQSKLFDPFFTTKELGKGTGDWVWPAFTAS